ncbi:MAG: CoA ester lyase [Acidobacteriota bacterium]
MQTDSGRLARSYLFVPGDNERLLGKVFDAGADAVVIDLEDAVSAERKDAARELVQRTLVQRAADDASRQPIWVRINDPRIGDWRADLEAVCGDPRATRLITGLRLPKAESLRQLQLLDEALRRVEQQASLPPESLRITCTIESATGVANAARLAALPRVSFLAFGEADFAADIGAELDADSTATLWARSSLVVAARSAGIAPPIAPVYTLLDDPEGLTRTTVAARRLGFFGRSCIHPRQLEPIHDAFTPTAERVAMARRILAAFDRNGGTVAVTEDGQFVDEAVVRRARAVLELAAMSAPSSATLPPEELP